jgi:hypothetical protein
LSSALRQLLLALCLRGAKTKVAPTDAIPAVLATLAKAPRRNEKKAGLCQLFCC